MKWLLLRLLLGREFGAQVYDLHRALKRAGLSPQKAATTAYLKLRTICTDMPYKPLTWKLNEAATAVERECVREGGSPTLSQITFCTVAQLAYEALTRRVALGKESALSFVSGEPRPVVDRTRPQRAS